MSRRPCARVAVLALCAACSFDPSALGGGGSNDGIGGDHGDASAAVGVDAMSLWDGTPSIDASPACLAAGCPGTCDQTGACLILCGGSGGDLLPEGGGPPPCGAVTCPAGVPCHVQCVGRDACDQPIDCSQAASCVIECNDERTCASQLTCGAGLCEVQCGGKDSCGGGVDCPSACFCDVSCQGESSCSQQTVCPPGCDNDPDCKTTGAGCDNGC